MLVRTGCQDAVVLQSIHDPHHDHNRSRNNTVPVSLVLRQLRLLFQALLSSAYMLQNC